MTGSTLTLAAIVLAALSPAAGQQAAMLDATADVGLTSVRDKTLFSNGRGVTTPIRQNQNWSGFENKTLLMAVDTRAVAGWTVERAWLHVWLAKGDLYGVGLCTVLAPWQEGRATNFNDLPGSPSWDYVRNPNALVLASDKATPEQRAAAAGTEWAWPGSKFFSVSWVHPAARFCHAGPGQIERDLAGMDVKPPEPGPPRPEATKIDPTVIQREQKPGNRFLHLRVPVDPKLVESLAAGVAYGLVLTDDKGQVAESYSLIGPAYPYVDNDAEDAWVYTQDISLPALRPRLEVHGAATDKASPGAPAGLKVASVSPSEGTVVLEFAAPGDDGQQGDLLAYDAAWSPEGPVTDANFAQANALPRWAIAPPAPGGKVQRFPIFTLPPGKYHIGIRGVDEAGNRGPVADIEVAIPAPPPATLPKGSPWRAPAPAAAPALGKLRVSAVDDLTGVDPVTGGILTDGTAYQADPKALESNSVWQNGCVSLAAAANEVAAFQLILSADESVAGIKVQAGDLAGPGGAKIAAANIEPYRLWYVSAQQGRGGGGRAAWHGEVCLPLEKPFDETFSLPAPDNKVTGQKHQAVWVDVYVPRGTKPGAYSGKLTVSAEGLGKPVEVSLAVIVLPLALPDRCSWIVELNRYHSPVGYSGEDARDPEKAKAALWSYYTLAHKHRLEMNALPYSHSGRTDADYVPPLAGAGAQVKVADWKGWDDRFGPLLDGSAFDPEKGYVGPGARTPISQMYLPFHEAWPLPVKDYYQDYKEVNERIGFAEYAKQARRVHVAFTKDYQDGVSGVARQFIEHFKAKRWTGTHFQFFYNNKYYWKVAYFGGMGTGGASFWLLDESSDFDDYDMQRFLWDLARRGVQAADAPDVKVHYRSDVSQPEMTRTLWDGSCNLWFVGGLGRFAATADVRRKFLPAETCWQYGGGAGVGSPPVEMMQRFLSTWCMGTEGIMPYWTTFEGGAGAWTRANPLAIFYSGSNYAGSGKNYPGPIPSVRMKVMRRCQQDVEYLHLLARTAGWDRPRVRRALATMADDPNAPVLGFEKLTTEQWRQLKLSLAGSVRQ